MNKKFPTLTIKSILRHRGLGIGLILIGALLAFEMFNYLTTFGGLHDMLGEAAFMGVRWATFLGLAMCLLDFGGLARIFTPEQGNQEPIEIKYLGVAWLCAVAVNGFLTWWAFTVRMETNPSQSAIYLLYPVLRQAMPIVIAVIETVIQISLIGAIATAGDRLFSYDEGRSDYKPTHTTSRSVTYTPPATPTYPRPTTNLPGQRPAAKPTQTPVRPPVYPGYVDPRDLP